MREAEVLPVQDDDVTGHRDGDPYPGRRPGRPRSERAEHAILDAALELFAESGVAGVCIEAVAARAGVGKATIYRRWPGKEELLLDALGTLKSPFPEPRGESVREDLTAMLRVMVADVSDPVRARRYALLLGEGEKYPKIMQRYKEAVVEPRRELMRAVLRRGIATGELRPDTNIEMAMLMLTGAVLARGREPGPCPPPEFAAHLVDEALRGLSGPR